MKAKIDRLLLIPTTGSPFDISDMVKEFNIYQSLTSHYMYCEIVMYDTVGISRAIPQDINNIITGGLTGGEIVLIQYTSVANPDKTHAFMLYERTNRSKTSESSEVYVMHGMSLEGFEAYSKKISKAYGKQNGSNARDIMKSIYDYYVYTKNVQGVYREIGRDFKSNIDKTLSVDNEDVGTYKYIIPNLTVDETIEFVCNETDSTDHIPQYLFFENSKGFWFYNLGSIAIQKPRQTYKFSEFNVDQTNMDQRKIISYEVKNGPNILENAKKGLFKSKTIHIDILKKQYGVSIFDYEKSVDKFKKLQPTRQRGNVSSADINMTMMTTRTGHNGDGLFDLERHIPKKIDRFLSKRRSYTAEIYSNKMSVMVPGTTALDVGDVVELQFPLKDGLRDRKDVVLDKDLSGKYIITELRNKIEDVSGSSSFVTIFECVKDTQILEN